MPVRCEWVGDWDSIDDIIAKYHDEEWGVLKHYDRSSFEDLVLDGAKAGLS